MLPDVDVGLSGNLLTIAPGAGFTGSFHVWVTGDDGHAGSHQRTFTVNVTGAVAAVDAVFEELGH